MREITKEQIIKDNVYKMTTIDYVKYFVIIGLAMIIGFINIVNFKSLKEIPDLFDILYALDELIIAKDSRILPFIAIMFFICAIAYIIADNSSVWKLKSDIRKGKFTITKCKVTNNIISTSYNMLDTYSITLDNINHSVEVDNFVKIGTEVYIITLDNGMILKPYFANDYTISDMRGNTISGNDVKNK